MPTVSVDDPEEVDVKKCDGEGRLYLGQGYENKEVSYIIEEIKEIEEYRRLKKDDDSKET